MPLREDRSARVMAVSRQEGRGLSYKSLDFAWSIACANGIRINADYTETGTGTWINAVVGAASNCSYFPNNSGHNVIS